MIYNSLQFLLLYPLLFLLYYAIPERWHRARNGYLLVVSYALYIKWKPVYALVLLFVTATTYFGALYLDRTRHRRLLLVGSLTAALAPLLFFKYYNFVNDSLCQWLSTMGMSTGLPGLNWAIPIGISFYTFQALGYLFDVAQRKIAAERDFMTYALFISFFPSILSGPINKASLMLPQLKSTHRHFDYAKAVEGLKMLLWGMVMKVVVADRCAIYVDTIVPRWEHFTGTTCFVASILYTIQIYADFAGYSLMAIGVGKTLGFELTENFRRPYFAVSVTDFWRRWHISLSVWLRDYIYIPLGGSRCSRLRNYWNIFVTFLVSGIWHGANWTFIVWGIWHGLAQIVEKMLGQQRCEYGPFGKAVKITITFLLVNFAWVFFRIPTLSGAVGMIAHIFDFSQDMSVFYDEFETPALIALGVLLLLLKEVRDEFFPQRLPLMNSRHTIVRWATYVFLIFTILLTGVFGADQFIYANF